MTIDEQIETFLRHHTFPYSNRKAAKAELRRIIDVSVQIALIQDYHRRHVAKKSSRKRREKPRLAGLVDGSYNGREITYSFGYGPGGSGS